MADFQQRINRITLQDGLGNVVYAADVTADLMRNGDTITFNMDQVTITEDGLVVPTNFLIEEEPCGDSG